jgi:hypothetical protein
MVRKAKSEKQKQHPGVKPKYPLPVVLRPWAALAAGRLVRVGVRKRE